MKESKLKNGTPILVVKVDHFVKAGDFALALTDHFYRKKIDFNENLTKKEAVEILQHNLFFHGLHGEYDAGFFEASTELGEIRNAIYDEAIKWVELNYPYLKKK